MIMKRRARWFILPVIGLSAMTRPVSYAQSGSTSYLPGVNYDIPAVIIKFDKLNATKTEMLKNNTRDVVIRHVAAGGHNVGLSLVYRLAGVNNDRPVIHDRVSEVYHILEGSATLLTGGTMMGAVRRPDSPGNGPGLQGASLNGAASQRLTKGDVVIIPAGTPHQWSNVEEFTLYTVTRTDPGAIVPLK